MQCLLLKLDFFNFYRGGSPGMEMYNVSEHGNAETYLVLS
jgi:hypothetical protein